jgi:hypothetical protein
MGIVIISCRKQCDNVLGFAQAPYKFGSQASIGEVDVNDSVVRTMPLGRFYGLIEGPRNFANTKTTRLNRLPKKLGYRHIVFHNQYIHGLDPSIIFGASPESFV